MGRQLQQEAVPTVSSKKSRKQEDALLLQEGGQEEPGTSPPPSEKKKKKRRQREEGLKASDSEEKEQLPPNQEEEKSKKRKREGLKSSDSEAHPGAEEKEQEDDKPKKKKKQRKSESETTPSSSEVEVEEEQPRKYQVNEHSIRITGVQDGETEVEPVEAFEAVVGFTKRVVKVCQKKFEKPTPIQSATWPLILKGYDVVGIAKTGSGKTLAFALPFLAMSERGELELFQQPSWCPRMVVLAPTRELAQQTGAVCEEFVRALAPKEPGMRYPVVNLVGGVPKQEQKRQIAEAGADIVCCTPGRLCDLAEGGDLDLSHTQLFVLDEGDRMLDMGFIDSVKAIAARLPKKHQTVLFSATWPSSVHRLAASLTKKKKTAKVTVSKLRKKGSEGEDEADAIAAEERAHDGQLKANENIKLTVEIIKDPREKQGRLFDILRNNKGKKILVFALYKKEAATLERTLQQRGFPEARALQGDMTQAARNEVMDGFKSGKKLRLLVATDVASRGLDVPDIDLVINYTFPLTIEDFVHRCGRTGRAGKSGEALTLFNVGRAEGVQEEKQHAGDLLRVLKEAGHQVPAELEKMAGSSQGNKATKKKAHPIYGNFFKDEETMAKLEAKKKHVTFDDSDAED